MCHSVVQRPRFTVLIVNLLSPTLHIPFEELKRFLLVCTILRNVQEEVGESHRNYLSITDQTESKNKKIENKKEAQLKVGDFFSIRKPNEKRLKNAKNMLGRKHRRT